MESESSVEIQGGKGIWVDRIAIVFGRNDVRSDRRLGDIKGVGTRAHGKQESTGGDVGADLESFRYLPISFLTGWKVLTKKVIAQTLSPIMGDRNWLAKTRRGEPAWNIGR